MSKRFLVVDDDSSIFLAYKKLFQNHGRILDTATSLHEAKILIDAYEYELLITDLRLSGVESDEGFEIIRYARDKHPTTKIIMVTAYGDAEIKEQAYRSGATFYFEKPLSIRVLKDALIHLNVDGMHQ